MSERPITDYQPERVKYTIFAREHYINEFGLSGRLLDAGCGDGFWSSVFREYGIETVGIDKDQSSIDRGLARWPFLDMRCMEIADATQNELGYFDWVFLRGVSPFYGATFTPCIVILKTVLRIADHVLLAFWTDQSGKQDKDGIWHYSLGTYAHMVEAAGGEVLKRTVAGKYLQIEAQCVT